MRDDFAEQVDEAAMGAATALGGKPVAVGSWVIIAENIDIDGGRKVVVFGNKGTDKELTHRLIIEANKVIRS